MVVDKGDGKTWRTPKKDSRATAPLRHRRGHSPTGIESHAVEDLDDVARDVTTREVDLSRRDRSVHASEDQPAIHICDDVGAFEIQSRVLPTAQ